MKEVTSSAKLLGILSISILILSMPFVPSAKAGSFDFIHIADMNVTLPEGGGILTIARSFGLIVNTDASNITSEDLDDLSFTFTPSVSGFYLSIRTENWSFYSPITPNEAVGSISPDIPSASGFNLLSDLIEGGETFRNIAPASISSVGVDRVMGNNYEGEVLFDITMELTGERISFQIRANMLLGTHSVEVTSASRHSSSCSAGGTTGSGDNIEVAPEDCLSGVVGGTPVTVTFDQVNVGGCTTLCTSTLGASPPSGYELRGPSREYEITTTAELETGSNIEVCINYGSGYCDENNLKLFHKENGQPWEHVTSSIDTVDNIICGDVQSFSTFGIFGPSSGAGPVIDKIRPRSRERGKNIRIIGYNFGETQGDGEVRIGKRKHYNDPALGMGKHLHRVRLWSPTKIKVRLSKRVVRKKWEGTRKYVWIEKDCKKSNYKRVTILAPSP